MTLKLRIIYNRFLNGNLYRFSYRISIVYYINIFQPWSFGILNFPTFGMTLFLNAGERDAFGLGLEVYTTIYLIEDLLYHENAIHKIPRSHLISSVEILLKRKTSIEFRIIVRRFRYNSLVWFSTPGNKLKLRSLMQYYTGFFWFCFVFTVFCLINEFHYLTSLIDLLLSKKVFSRLFEFFYSLLLLIDRLLNHFFNVQRCMHAKLYSNA